MWGHFGIKAQKILLLGTFVHELIDPLEYGHGLCTCKMIDPLEYISNPGEMQHFILVFIVCQGTRLIYKGLNFVSINKYISIVAYG